MKNPYSCSSKIPADGQHVLCGLIFIMYLVHQLSDQVDPQSADLTLVGVLPTHYSKRQSNKNFVVCYNCIISVKLMLFNSFMIQKEGKPRRKDILLR